MKEKFYINQTGCPCRLRWCDSGKNSIVLLHRLYQWLSHGVPRDFIQKNDYI